MAFNIATAALAIGLLGAMTFTMVAIFAACNDEYAWMAAAIVLALLSVGVFGGFVGGLGG